MRLHNIGKCLDKWLPRGIRQGDPLSPFLYVVAAEGLNALMKKVVKDGLIKPAAMRMDKVVVSHLQYADDTLFAVQGNVEDERSLRWLLKNFEAISGLKVNFSKSCVYGVNVNG